MQLEKRRVDRRGCKPQPFSAIAAIKDVSQRNGIVLDLFGGSGSGAPKGNRNAWKHGNYSSREKARRALMRLLLKT